MTYGHERQPQQLAPEVAEETRLNFETDETALVSVLTSLGNTGLDLSSQNFTPETNNAQVTDQQFETFLEEHTELNGLSGLSNELAPFYLGQELSERTTLEPSMYATPTQTLDGRTGEWKYDGDKND